ncbi:MAG: VanZ family protein [Cyclobacteriaceae bacterium]|jgi:VanZ family protein|nr:VanZ family protein [Chitinophagales bacterium]TXH27950.1 MAG: VanZ family protein [Cyclobacteriaceae bacterium]HMU73144.1 VanZ family protein [Ferruginibacter sp.]HMX36576.1 VanZ family protein [Ferruginibacter sp.]HMX80785.1 VanZ family protein [Ferruginibacter sp.]
MQQREPIIPIKQLYPGIAWFFVILILISIPGYDLPKIDNWLIEINYDKLIHTFLFAVLAYLFMRPVMRSALAGREKWNWLIRITLAAILYGITTEYIQKFFIPGRSFNLADWLADALGGVLMFAWFALRFKKMSGKV